MVLPYFCNDEIARNEIPKLDFNNFKIHITSKNDSLLDIILITVYEALYVYQDVKPNILNIMKTQTMRV